MREPGGPRTLPTAEGRCDLLERSLVDDVMVQRGVERDQRGLRAHIAGGMPQRMIRPHREHVTDWHDVIGRLHGQIVIANARLLAAGPTVDPGNVDRGKVVLQ